MRRTLPLLLLSLLSLSVFAFRTDTVTLLFGGDAMGHSPQFKWAYRPADGTYDYEPNFRYIKPYIGQSDYSVVNLEVTLAGEPYSGYPNFSSPDAYFHALRGAGFDMYLLANNHILDRGRRGLQRTLSVIGEVANAGVYLDSLDRRSRYPLIEDVCGVRIAFFNCTYGCNGYLPLPPNMVNFIDTAEIRRDLLSIRDSAVDVRVMCIHWGVEYELRATARQRELARWLAEQGFDLIIGGHPHVVEDAEIIQVQNDNGKTIREVPVYYSLGNLISNQRRENTNGGILVAAKLIVKNRLPHSKHNAHGKRLITIETSYLPCYVHKGTISYETDGQKKSERQYFLLPTTDYLSGRYSFRLSSSEESALRLFHTNTTERLQNMRLTE
ncbi:MAG: CapA family protein [Paludibacteraceae bacterium]|nr:CapA family protein [Paludibacteraceae bacterium]